VLWQDKIEVGDVLDELNGIHITTSQRGRLSSIMRKASGQPIVVNIIKVCILILLHVYGSVHHHPQN
jgi:hypothetical protein